MARVDPTQHYTPMCPDVVTLLVTSWRTGPLNSIYQVAPTVDGPVQADCELPEGRATVYSFLMVHSDTRHTAKTQKHTLNF